MKRILFVTYDAYPHEGGKSTHIKYLIDGLTELGIKCDVVSFNDANQMENTAGKVLMQPCKLFGKDCYLYYRLQVGKAAFRKAVLKKLKNNNYDMISAQDAISGSILNKIAPDCNNISLTMHTYFGLENGLDNSALCEGNKYYDRMKAEELEALQCAHAVIAVDERIEKHVVETVDAVGVADKCKVFCVRNFINTNAFEHCPARSENDTLNVICVRRLVEKNGVIYAVKAMEHCSDKVRLHIVGDGPEMPKIQEYVKNGGLENRVVLHGAMKNDQVLSLYKTCNAAVVPSITVNGLQEATSISALEAMACSMPIVVSSIGGLRLLVEDGKTGFWANERDSQEIGSKLQWIFDHPGEATQIGANARQFVEKHHSHLSAAKSYLNIFSGNNTGK